MSRLFQVMRIGEDGMGYPIVREISRGAILVDIELGKGDWHTITPEGEPLCRIPSDVVLEIIEPPEDHITWFDDRGNVLDCTTVDAEATDSFIRGLSDELGIQRSEISRYEREPYLGAC